jgi:hypothetical protein
MVCTPAIRGSCRCEGSEDHYRSPAFEGDVTYLNGRVVQKRPASVGNSFVDLEVTMTSQSGNVLARGPVEVRFSR